MALSGCSISIGKKSNTVNNEYFTYLGYEKTNVITDNKINVGIKLLN